MFSVLYLLWWKLNSPVRYWCRGGEGQLIQRRVDSHHGTTETHLSRKHIIYLNTVHCSPHTHTHPSYCFYMLHHRHTHAVYVYCECRKSPPCCIFQPHTVTHRLNEGNHTLSLGLIRVSLFHPEASLLKDGENEQFVASSVAT